MAANDVLLDAAIERQIGILRVSNGFGQRFNRSLRETEPAILDMIDRLPPSPSRRTLNSALRRFSRIRGNALGSAEEALRDELRALAVSEQDFQVRTLTQAILGLIGINRGARVGIDQIIFQGFTLSEHLNTIRRNDERRVKQAIVIAASSGLSGSQRRGLLRRAFQTTGRDIRTITRTAAIQVANAQRTQLYRANRDVVKSVLWVATLDTRTSLICAGLDGRVFPLDDIKRMPPAHYNCRSILTPITRNITQGTPAQRASINGPVPAKQTYGQWLQRQSVSVQNEVLGPTRARAFRAGEIEISQFTDSLDNTLTLQQLDRRYNLNLPVEDN